MSPPPPPTGAEAGARGDRVELADIVRAHGADYRRAHPLALAQHRALQAIEDCRTAALGGHRERCEACGAERITYNSCRNRHCPKCQRLATERWLAARRRELLPIEYFHVVFTLPHALNPSLRLGGVGYRDLTQNHSDIAGIFDNYNLAVMSVITNSEELINELFVRLNRSKPLTGAEIRNAMVGPAPEVIREMAKHEFFSELVTFPVQRGQDLNAAAKLLLFEFHSKPQETKKTSLDAFVRVAGEQRDRLELAARRVHAALNDLTSIFLPNDRLLSSAGVIPVYYWFMRSIKERQYRLVRDFLVRFEEDRKENRQRAASSGATGVDRQLLEYDRFNRSTNDLASHVGRIKILQKKFEQFIT